MNKSRLVKVLPILIKFDEFTYFFDLDKTAPLVLGGRGRRDPEFDDISDFISSLRTNLTSIDKVASKLINALNGMTILPICTGLRLSLAVSIFKSL